MNSGYFTVLKEEDGKDPSIVVNWTSKDDIPRSRRLLAGREEKLMTLLTLPLPEEEKQWMLYPIQKDNLTREQFSPIGNISTIKTKEIKEKQKKVIKEGETCQLSVEVPLIFDGVKGEQKSIFLCW
jgi:hypothetical protein